MKRKNYALIALALVVFYLGSVAFDLDLGYFGIGLLILAAGFGIKAIVTPGAHAVSDGGVKPS